MKKKLAQYKKLREDILRYMSETNDVILFDLDLESDKRYWKAESEYKKEDLRKKFKKILDIANRINKDFNKAKVLNVSKIQIRYAVGYDTAKKALLFATTERKRIDPVTVNNIKDEKYSDAVKYVLKNNDFTILGIQSALDIGYARSASLLSMILEDKKHQKIYKEYKKQSNKDMKGVLAKSLKYFKEYKKHNTHFDYFTFFKNLDIEPKYQHQVFERLGTLGLINMDDIGYRITK